jgi:hypothetical protein
MALVQIPPASSVADGYTLLNTGGTALTGATSITISGITSNDLLILVASASTASGNAVIGISFNGSANGHYYNGSRILANASYAATNFDNISDSNSGTLTLARGGSTAAYTMDGYCMVQGAKSTKIKPYWFAGGAVDNSGNGQRAYTAGGYFNAAAPITSLSLQSTAGNFDNGTIYVYGRD